MKSRKEYMKQYYAKNAEKIKQYYAENAEKIKQYRAENAEKIRTRGKQYRAENAEKIKTRKKQYYAKNAEKIKQYYAENAEKIKTRRKQYCRTLKGRYKKLRCSAKIRGIHFNLPMQEYELLVTNQNCYYCEGNLPETGGGLDRVNSNQGYTTDNVVPCCARCNKVLLDMPKQEAYAHIRQMLQVYEKKLAMIYQNSTMNKEEL